MSKKEEIISLASPHTIKKFELIEYYVEKWAHILMNNIKCRKLIFIDCMSNSGEYVNDKNEQVFGTPVRVSKILYDIAKKYYPKKVEIYFNDFSEEKINHLKSLLTYTNSNFDIHYSVKDGNDLLKELAPEIINNADTHYLLVYDPYDASIDWSAILPYINNWGEVIINHMLQDSIRAIKVAKKPDKIEKYQTTYLTDIDKLLSYNGDKVAFEERIQEIIRALRNNTWSKYYLASFPFFNGKNSTIYNLIHCSSNIKGFKLFKYSAWKVFDGKSSTKDTHGKQMQLEMDFDNGEIKTGVDEDCYYIKDIAEFLQNTYSGKSMLIDKIWDILDVHPIFPSEGFRNEIKKELREYFGAIIKNSTITFKAKD